jgi:hypothetical protein
VVRTVPVWELLPAITSALRGVVQDNDVGRGDWYTLCQLFDFILSEGEDKGANPLSVEGEFAVTRKRLSPISQPSPSETISQGHACL